MKNKYTGELVWKSEEEQLKELEKVKKTSMYGTDGKIVSAEGKFVYRGIAYTIMVLRYYNFREGFTTMGSERISPYHAVVEFPEETKPIADLVYNFDSEFLYHDTLHYWNDKQTAEQQIQVCHNWAMKDIDNLFDGEIAKKIDNSIKELQKAKDNLKIKSKEVKELKSKNDAYKFNQEYLDKAKEIYPSCSEDSELGCVACQQTQNEIMSALAEAEEKGILKGFKMSAEGFNGEYPFEGKSDEYILKGLKKLQEIKNG